MTKSKRLAFFLPNTFTALNMACGFVSILLSTQGKIYEAAMLLILGAIFDSVDGRIARMTGTSSSFGEQFDSLSDLISFGIAPAILVYQKYLFLYGRLGAAVSFIYLLCVALRLARFNANIEKVSSSYFQGLPSPGAALAIIGAVLLATEFSFVDHFSLLFLPYTVFYAFLMITTVPFYSFKNSAFIKKHRKLSLFVLFISVALMTSYYQVMIAIVMLCYAATSLIYYLKNRKNIVDAFEWTDENDH
jgi:CDP-diacylglycerol--serine O-phosphatidyltransferase